MKGTRMLQNIISTRDLRVSFHTEEGVIRAVNGVDLDIRENTTLGIMGESGCGKSVTALSIMGLAQRIGKVTGEIRYTDRDGGTIDLATLPWQSDEYRSIRGGDIAMIFQEPMTSLSPVYTCGNQTMEVTMLHRGLTDREARHDAIEMFQRVGIPEAEKRIDQYPFEFSGGMAQRVMIAIALSCRPRLLIADEPTTALDVTTQAQILKLIRQVRDEFQMAVVMITHDLGVIAAMCEEVATMYRGQIVEFGSTEAVFYRHFHPYTVGLLRSIPVVSQERVKLKPIEGNVPHDFTSIAGCQFHPRCERFMVQKCLQTQPLLEVEEGHFVRCCLYA